MQTRLVLTTCVVYPVSKTTNVELTRDGVRKTNVLVKIARGPTTRRHRLKTHEVYEIQHLKILYYSTTQAAKARWL